MDEYISKKPESEDEFNALLSYLEALYYSETSYLNLIDTGWKAQDARGVLPNATKTEIVVKANFREWLHIFKLRTSIAAHPQIRSLMQELESEFHKRCPEIFQNDPYDIM